MDTFLNRLVMRTLGLIPGVQPLLDPLFVPSSSLTGDDSETNCDWSGESVSPAMDQTIEGYPSALAPETISTVALQSPIHRLLPPEPIAATSIPATLPQASNLPGSVGSELTPSSSSNKPQPSTTAGIIQRQIQPETTTLQSLPTPSSTVAPRESGLGFKQSQRHSTIEPSWDSGSEPRILTGEGETFSQEPSLTSPTSKQPLTGKPINLESDLGANSAPIPVAPEISLPSVNPHTPPRESGLGFKQSQRHSTIEPSWDSGSEPRILTGEGETFSRVSHQEPSLTSPTSKQPLTGKPINLESDLGANSVIPEMKPHAPLTLDSISQRFLKQSSGKREITMEHSLMLADHPVYDSARIKPHSEQAASETVGAILPGLASSSEVGVGWPLVEPQLQEEVPRRDPTDSQHRTRGLPGLSSPTPPPTVQVKIGRIEVRRLNPSSPSTPRSRPQPTGPTLSLNDYLKQRNGGEL
jgi:hypothetical protein